jgi:hypothetical protein
VQLRWHHCVFLCSALSSFSAAEKAFLRQWAENINHFNEQRDLLGRFAMNTDDMQKFGKGSMDIATNAAGAWGKAAQAIAVEFVDYTKKSAEASAAAWEKLLGAKSLDKAIEIQTEYLRSSYEDFVAEAAKFGELYTDMARQAYQPFESALRK